MKKKPTYNNQKGFTLIEMALSTIITGVLIAMAFSVYKPYIEKKKIETTKENLISAYSAIENFKADLGYYPCPASLTANRTSVEYGVPNDLCSDTTVAVGSCKAGNEYCVRDAIPARAAVLTANGVSTRVRLGALPFRDINISEEESYDGFGSRLYYAVTESMAIDTSNYSLSNGAIDIIDSRGNQSLMEVPGSGSFIVFSVGENKVGGYSLEGSALEPCGLPHTGRELLNCQVATNATFYSNAHVDVAAANEMDDYILFNNPELNIDLAGWRFGSPLNAENEDDVLTGRRVRVGDFSSAVRADFEIVGDDEDMKTTDNFLVESDICDHQADGSPDDCFQINRLERTCPPGQYITGIGSTVDELGNPTNISCAPLLFNCPVGQTISGINPDGSVACVPMPIPAGVVPTPPPPVCGETRATPHPCPHGIPGTYDVFEAYSCTTLSWSVTGNNQTTACCTADPTPRTTTQSTTSVGNPWWICGRYGQGTRDETRTLNTSNCSYQYTHSNYSCTCLPTGRRYVNPRNLDRSREHIATCGIQQFSYPLNSSGQCWHASGGAWVSDGTVNPNPPFRWVAGTPTGEIRVPLNSMKKVGESCNYGDANRSCASRNPVPGTNGKHTIMRSCSCQIANDPTRCRGSAP